MPGFYMGLETGDFKYYTYGSPIYFYQTIKTESVWKLSQSNCDQISGEVLQQTRFNQTTFDPRIRPWYIQAKAAKAHFWSSPYLDHLTGEPVITIMNPLLNISLYGTQYDWAGATAADIFLTNINNFLKRAYTSEDHKVFIIDSNLGYLLGSSWEVPTCVTTPSGKVQNK